MRLLLDTHAFLWFTRSIACWWRRHWSRRSRSLVTMASWIYT